MRARSSAPPAPSSSTASATTFSTIAFDAASGQTISPVSTCALRTSRRNGTSAFGSDSGGVGGAEGGGRGAWMREKETRQAPGCRLRRRGGGVGRGGEETTGVTPQNVFQDDGAREA